MTQWLRLPFYPLAGVVAIVSGLLLAAGSSEFSPAVWLGGIFLTGYFLYALINPESAFLVLLFLIPLNRPITLWEMEGRTLYISLPDVLFLLCAFGYFARRMISSQNRNPVSWREVPQICWLAGVMVFSVASWIVVSLDSSQSLRVSLLSMLRLFRFPAYYLLAIKLAHGRADNYWKIVVWSGACCVLVGLMQAIYPELVESIWEPVSGFGTDSRIHGSFTGGGPNLYGAYLGALFTLACALFLYHRRFPARPFLLVLMVGSLASLFFTLSRSGLIVLIVALLALLLVARGLHIRSLLVVSAILVVAYLYQPTTLQERVEMALYGVSGPSRWEGYDYTVWRRISLTRLAWQEMTNRPWFGRGFRPIAPEIAVEGFTETTLHNMYLDIGVKAGVPAMLCFVGFLGFSLWELWRAGRAATDPARKAFLCGLWAALVGLAVSSITQENFSDDNLAPLVWSLMGVAVYLVRMRQPTAATVSPGSGVAASKVS